MKNASKVSAANVLNAIVKHPHNRTGANKEGFYKLSRKFEIALFGEGAPEVGTVVTDGTNSITVVSVEMNNQDGSINGVRCVEGKLNAAEAAKAGAAFGGHFLTYNFFLPSSMPKMVEIELNAETAEVIAPVADSTPTLEELEERINDLPVKKGRGYANAGKKYEHSGVRIEEFKLGKAKVKKGDKLYFKIGKVEVVGVFSHLNQCVHCPEGYAVIRFEGKNFERRQSRISTTPTAE